MRAVWIDAGSDPRTDLGLRFGIHRAYFPSHVEQGGRWIVNPKLTADYLYGPLPDRRGGWRAAVGGVGIYFGSSWPIFLTPDGLAQELSRVLTLIGADSRQCAVDVNREQHDFDLVSFLRAWRAVRPNRETSWLIEGMQGGRLAARQIAAVNTDPNLTVLAEAFFDEPGHSMQPFDPDRVRCDLIDYGIQRARAQVCYDAAHLLDRWDGRAFTQGRLPS
jgi:hypothetical protein